MIDKEKVINELENTAGYFRYLQSVGFFGDQPVFREHEAHCNDAITLLKEQEVRELTMDEWQEWKNNPKRNPICELWENDTSPMWVLNPDAIHEPALLMGKLKLFTGKPTFEQCKEVKWE